MRALGPERGGQVPAAALTAYARARTASACSSAGFQVHLAKPVQPAELANVVATLAGTQTVTRLEVQASCSVLPALRLTARGTHSA